MIKAIALLSRKEGMTHEQFIDHWVNIHGPMGHEMPEVRRYVQNFVVDQPTRADVPQLQIDGDVDILEGLLDVLAHLDVLLEPASRHQAEFESGAALHRIARDIE